MLYGKPMLQGKFEKYLGFFLGATAAESIAATVDKRLGIATKALYEARAIVEDSRADSIGGLTVMFNIFEHAIAPMLFYSCEVWYPLNNKVIKKLNRLKITYL